MFERLKNFAAMQFFFCKRKIYAIFESVRCYFVTTGKDQLFYVVSCERNAGRAAIKCLDSVYRQKYSKSLITHLFIDDSSDDGTHQLIQNWLNEHPDHNVDYIHNSQRQGGTANTLKGFSRASEGAIVMELNGDDWFPDAGIALFYNKIYADEAVWMTYNTLKLSDGPPASWSKKWPGHVIKNNSFREQKDWTAGPLQTFRRRLFDYIDEDVFIDPETGAYWECADDQAVYLCLFELAGQHSEHISRISYVYNFNETSHAYVDKEKSIRCATRIRAGRRYQPLEAL